MNLNGSNIPRMLFRFRTWPATDPNRTRQILEQGTLYCSSPREFDDPHDNQLGAHATGSDLDIDRWLILDMGEVPDLMRKYNLSSITQLNTDTITDPEDRKVLARMAGRNVRRHSRVLCFSGDCSNELMWAFYTDNHTGICLGFDTQHELFQAAKPVLYTHSPTDVDHLAQSGGAPDQLAFCKSLAWQFQKEWRIVLPGAEPRRVAFPKQSLKLVILGYRFPDRHFDDLKKTLITGSYQVDIIRVQRIPNRYELGFLKDGSIAPKQPQQTPPQNPTPNVKKPKTRRRARHKGT